MGPDRRPVLGARLSKAGLNADLPHAFKTLEKAAEFRRGRSTAAMKELARRIAAANAWHLTILELRPNRGGQSIPAAVFADTAHSKKIAASLWPNLKITAGGAAKGN